MSDIEAQVNIPGIEVTDLDALKQWLDSEEHWNCAANNEGLLCCLDKLAGVTE